MNNTLKYYNLCRNHNLLGHHKVPYVLKGKRALYRLFRDIYTRFLINCEIQSKLISLSLDSKELSGYPKMILSYLDTKSQEQNNPNNPNNVSTDRLKKALGRYE